MGFLKSTDIGSLPLRVDVNVLNQGARKSNSLLSYLGVKSESFDIFQEEVLSAFIDKIRIGIEVPNYPQFRDMNEMYFELLRGYERGNEGLLAIDKITAIPNLKIPEVEAIKRNLSFIRERTNVEKVKIKLCVTGPYTLLSFFQFKTPQIIEDLGKALTDIVSNNLFKTKYGEVTHLSVDEPVLGFINDPLLDFGTNGREKLCQAWELICSKANSHDVSTSMHLHNTSNDLFWDVRHLNVVASHVDDPIYSQESTKKRLKETDKQLMAPVAITLFDNLIQNYHLAKGFTGNIPEKIGETWNKIRKSELDPIIFVEDSKLIKSRLKKILDEFCESVTYVSPECGLSSFPSYEIAFECLKRVTSIVNEMNEKRVT